MSEKLEISSDSDESWRTIFTRPNITNFEEKIVGQMFEISFASKESK